MDTNYLAHYGVKGMKWTKNGGPRRGLRTTFTARGTRTKQAHSLKTVGRNSAKRYSSNGSKTTPDRGSNTSQKKSTGTRTVYSADLHGGHWETIKGTRWNQPWGPTKPRYPSTPRRSGVTTSVYRVGGRASKSNGTVTNAITGRTIKGNRMNSAIWGSKSNSPVSSRTTSYRNNAVRSGRRSNAGRDVYDAVNRLRNGRQRAAGRQK